MRQKLFPEGQRYLNEFHNSFNPSTDEFISKRGATGTNLYFLTLTRDSWITNPTLFNGQISTQVKASFARSHRQKCNSLPLFRLNVYQSTPILASEGHKVSKCKGGQFIPKTGVRII
ncbi:Uncharacterised protein r2_g216 [Pycnogonum litorale]